MLVSVYIRKEDEDKWKQLDKKTEAIHNMLNHGLERHSLGQTVDRVNKIIKTPKQAEKAIESTGFISKSYSARKKK